MSRVLPDQKQIDDVWRRAWKEEEGVSAKKILGSRLSVESYNVVKKYIPADVKNILEIGTGTGRFAVRFGQDFPAAKIIATDILDESLASTEKLKQELGVHNIETKKEDVTSLSFNDNFFDVVFCDAVIQHLPDYQRAVDEMCRVVKPGGLLMVSVVNFWNFHTLYKSILGKKYHYGFEKSFTHKELGDSLKKNNFKIIGQDGWYPAYGVVRLKRQNPIWGPIGKVCDKGSRLLDKISNRRISKNFGFEILIVGKKI